MLLDDSSELLDSSSLLDESSLLEDSELDDSMLLDDSSELLDSSSLLEDSSKSSELEELSGFSELLDSSSSSSLLDEASLLEDSELDDSMLLEDFSELLELSANERPCGVLLLNGPVMVVSWEHAAMRARTRNKAIEKILFIFFSSARMLKGLLYMPASIPASSVTLL